jgi:two-component system, sensor histidine kinase LadS
MHSSLSRLLIGLFCLLSATLCSAQKFDSFKPGSIQPVLSEPLRWVRAPASAAPSLPDAFAATSAGWAFETYSDSTVLPTGSGNDVWVRFTFAPSLLPQSWIVRMPQTTIEKVSLYSLRPDGGWHVQTAGAAIAPSQWSLPTRDPSFEVHTRSTLQTYFIRFEHSSPISEHPSLMDTIDFSDDLSRTSTLIGLMFGMFGILMVVCIASNHLADNTVFLSLAAFVAAILLTHLVLMGYGGWRLWPDSVYLNRAMRWTAPLLALAAGSWFCAQASYAKATSTLVYRLLGFSVVGSLALAGITLATGGALPHDLFNGWVAFVLLAVMGSLVRLCWMGQRWNWWLLSGLVPIAGAASSRLAYNYGWFTRADAALTVSVLLTQTGLMWLFLALAWRSRAALLANERKTALESHDAATGLKLASVVKVHLPHLLLRADRLKSSCGVMMVRWVDYDKNISTLNSAQHADALAVFGKLLQRAARDIDTAARFDDANFIVLVEGPVNRAALASVATQVISSCLRASEKAGKPNLFDVHIAVWQATEQTATAEEVLELLDTRLDQMAAGTQRAVQFADTLSSAQAPDAVQASRLRRQDVMAKIEAIESSPRLPRIRVPKSRKPPL